MMHAVSLQVPTMVLQCRSGHGAKSGAAHTPPLAPQRLVRSQAAAAGAGGHRQDLPSAWVQGCLRSAQQTAVLVDGVPFIPLSEAQRWFEAGAHEGDEKHALELNGVLAERERLVADVEVMAEAALKDHDAQDLKLRRLLSYALALEKEVDRAKGAMEEAALAAAHDAEERTLLQYQQALLEYERQHEAEVHDKEASLQGEVKRLHDLLHAAHGAKKQWRARALQVEAQFAQLRELIQTSLQATTDAAVARREAEAQAAAEAAASPARGPLRSSEDVPPADASVAHLHSMDVGAAAAGRTAAHRPLKHHRRGAPPDPRETPSLHSL